METIVSACLIFSLGMLLGAAIYREECRAKDRRAKDMASKAMLDFECHLYGNIEAYYGDAVPDVIVSTTKTLLRVLEYDTQKAKGE